MAKHLYLVKKIRVETAFEMAIVYRSAIRQGLSPVKAKQWTMRTMEYDRQGSGFQPLINDLSPQRKWYGIYRHSNPNTFDRLMYSALGYKPTHKDLFRPSAMLHKTKRHNPDMYCALRTASENYNSLTLAKTTIYSITQNVNTFASRRIADYERSWVTKERGRVTYSHIKEWAKIARGKDLFIKGLGTFNINNVVDLVRANERVVAVDCLRAVGYNLPGDLLEDLRKYAAVRKWVCKWANWIKDNPNILDEITWFMDYRRLIAEGLTPQQVIRRVRERQGGLRRTRFSGDFPVASKLPVVQTEHGTLRPLESSEEVEKVAYYMQNCCANYIDNMGAGKLALIGLFDGDKIKALGTLNLHTKKGQLDQLEGPCHEDVSGAIEDHFYNYIDYYDRMKGENNEG